MTDMNELQRCPFCDSHALCINSDDTDRALPWYWVECEEETCRAQGPKQDSMQLAMREWNYRLKER